MQNAIPDDSVYNELHRYAFDYINQNYLLKKDVLSGEIYTEAVEFLRSANAKTEEEKKSSEFINTVTNNIYVGECKYILKKSVKNLTSEEKKNYEKEKENIKNNIDESINKNLKIKKQTEELDKAKEKLHESKAEVIKSNNGTNYLKMDDVDNKPFIAEMVGNTTAASMIDNEASFIIDGSFNSIKSSDEIIDDLKKNKITNSNTFDLNNMNTTNMNSDVKEDVSILKSYDDKLDLKNAKYDSTTNLAFNNKGEVLDVEVKDNTISVNKLDTGEKYDFSKNKNENKIKTKEEFYAMIEDDMLKGTITKEEEETKLKNIEFFNTLSDETKQNILNNFSNSQKENINSKSNSNNKVLKYTYTNDTFGNSAKVSTVILSFIAGIISGGAIALLIYFFMTH